MSVCNLAVEQYSSMQHCIVPETYYVVALPEDGGRSAGAEGGDSGHQPGRAGLRPQCLHSRGVLGGGGVALDLQELRYLSVYHDKRSCKCHMGNVLRV